MLEFLIPIISFLGIFIGLLLKKIASEEVKFGKFGPKYFVWMKRIILFIMISTILFFGRSYLFLMIGLVLGLILGVFITEYFFLGISTAISFSLSQNILLVISSLTFLYGLPYCSILRKIKLKQTLLIVCLYFIPFISLLTNTNIDLLIGISAGGLFQYLIRR